jgi:thiamine biosynthesis lipoprotein
VSVHRFSHAAMNTVFEVHCVHPEAGYARQAAQAAFERLDRLEQELSRFIGNSDVSRVNGLRAGGVTRVLPSTLECLALAMALYELTDGAFDVSLGTGLPALELDRERFSVRVLQGGVAIDLGGIGKGYAVDRMVELLGEWDIRQGLVHGGFSSVRALEPPAGGEGWPLTLSAPGRGGREVLARVCAAQRSFSASGTEKGAHIVDPRDGRPAPDRVTWVSVPSLEGGASPAAMAEGLSTAFMVLGLPEVEQLCRSCPGVEAWLALEPREASVGPRLVHFSADGASDSPLPRVV